MREMGNQTGLDCWLPDCRDWNHLGLLVRIVVFVGLVIGLGVAVVALGGYNQRRPPTTRWFRNSQEVQLLEHIQLAIVGKL